MFLVAMFLVVPFLVVVASSCGSGSAVVSTAELNLDSAASDSSSPTVAAAGSTAPVPTVPAEPTPDPTPMPIATPEPTATPIPGHDAPGRLVVPESLPPGDPGSVIATEPYTLPGGEGWRILHHSRSTMGDDIAVSGFVAIPAGDPPEGGWPLIAWAHGTTGLGDVCAPSADAETDPLATALVNFGYAIVATDYEGLGTPGVHPYVVGPSEAHSVLDSVRAVREMGLPVSDDWVVFGLSQGGHAALWTGQLQPTYAPELDLIGVVAAAPPSQLRTLNEALIGSDFQGYLVMSALGVAAAYPDLSLDQVFSPTALDLLDVTEWGCAFDIFDTYNPLPYEELVTVENPFDLPGWGGAIAAQDTNKLPVTQPLFIIHGDADEQIPVETSATLLEQLCTFPDQGPSTRTVYPGEDHAGVLTNFTAVPDLLDWVDARFAGEPAPTTAVEPL